ncbi:MAG: bifunctional phosphopantothenoylcysteine decarboxylase/phosphopantothenate--cysteine ligase CoaBC [Alphaproteobacteria bacterium]|nr:bifunctional phosphopantothenoylcysteine decarboxylase/phosphopantothenate--cysteine ligase CoaBC [Alphaproteobacteria bacterium]MBP7758940.1 bifunctional phosphopantothenoylcysteine decarboxylase/phosphopantothenate--cysteine ligase CoaBC [Alphaproteobacteria bacterium]MBP7762215.1 bifunctional phosphopantothenoylcysteine decarboxylase/phosphopantothenate--cysteine ligase CoaBC [Alphaproteobacteria bacterium]MBP7904208.1 bifunctional phosphopantothenoylcysteine decarboxylase/phosphopantothen
MKLLDGKNILLIISGGIAAYKALELIRLLRRSGVEVRCILTAGGAQFITPLSVSSLTGQKTYTDLWSLSDETEMGHIRLSREADLIVIAPASADLMAKMSHGLANDLATTTLLASNKPVLIAPAMNPEMWSHAATQANIQVLRERGSLFIGPEAGDMACGEIGVGRMSEPSHILEAVESFFEPKALAGYRAVVTSGPTFEPLDPVRFLGNRSSGKQGHAIAQALAEAGASVTLVCGPVHLPNPQGVRCLHVETAAEMLKACETSLPADIFIGAAAVSDWRPAQQSSQKIKKISSSKPKAVQLTENPDILKTIATKKRNRPKLVIGFAAETENLEKNARAKLKSKGCDWILANRVGPDGSGKEKTFGSPLNKIVFVSSSGIKEWPLADKKSVAVKLVRLIEDEFKA